MKRGKISNYIRDRRGDKTSSRAKNKYFFNKQKKICKGDTVMVTAGDDINKTGVVLVCMADRAIVQGLNMCKKAVKKSEQRPDGGFLDLERPIHISNLRVCDESRQPVKLKVQSTNEGTRQLVYKTNGKDVIHRVLKNNKT